MNEKPNVLIFDDDPDWAEQIAIPLRRKFEVITISNPDDWDIHVSGGRRDVIIIDVQILGDDLDGPNRAKQSILKFRITAPIIVISGVVSLPDIQNEHGEMFFEYVHKDDCIKELPPLVESACLPDNRKIHIQKMTTRIAKLHNILDHEFPSDWIVVKYIKKIFVDSNKKTIKDLISMMHGSTSDQIANMGKTILQVITKTIKEITR